MPDPPVVNEAVRLDGEFRDNSHALIDVPGPSVLVRMPDATTTTYSDSAVVHDSLGLYHANHVAAQVGTHNVRWLDSGGRVVLEYEFYVSESTFDAPEDWQPVTAAEVEAQSQLNFDALGLTSRRLQTAVESATAWIEWVTGRKLDATLPTGLQPIAREAVRMRVEQLVGRGSPDAIGAAGQEGVQSVSAGGASVTFRDPNVSRGTGSGLVPTSWPALNENLWALMVPFREDYWRGILTGIPAAAMAVTEVDWTNWRGAIWHEDYGWGGGWGVP